MENTVKLQHTQTSIYHNHLKSIFTLSIQFELVFHQNENENRSWNTKIISKQLWQKNNSIFQDTSSERILSNDSILLGYHSLNKFEIKLIINS